MSRYLINIAVGPVQEFIASARKLRDLWYGSFLLSELSKTVARSLIDQGCSSIFPAIQSSKDLQTGSAMNVANKIMAISPQGGDPEEIVSEARKAFFTFWETTCEDALQKAKKILPHNSVQKQLFYQQVNDFGEFFAAWVEYDETDYHGSRSRCEQRLAGRKNLREFSAPSWNGTGKPKSSLDGIRESVFCQKDADSYMVNKGEQLDTLGLVKRFGPLTSKQRPMFDNLAQLAAQPYVEGLQKAAREHREIAEILSGLPKVDDLYPKKQDRPRGNATIWNGWPDGLSTEILFPSVVQGEIRQRTGKNASSAWNRLEKDLKKLWARTAEPLPYGCLLLGDGDKMGEALNSLTQEQQHQQFSTALESFASDVHPLVQQYQGQVVYSGGDDVMAYVPLHKALDCAQAVNDAFAKTMDIACRNTTIAPKPTFSMGMVIVHFHKPLHEILELARQAEKYAKNEGERNCLAIIQSKRSGSDLVVSGKWVKDGSLAPLATRMNDFIELYRLEKLSSRLGYQLRSLSKECGDTLEWVKHDPKAPGNFTTAEALRTIGRKREKSGRVLFPDDGADLLAGQTSLRQLADELIIAHQINSCNGLATTTLFR